MPDRPADNHLCASLAVAALILFVPAITLPFLRIERLGIARDNSLLGGISALFQEGHRFVGLVILLFSIVLPLLKLGALLTLSLKNQWLPQRHRASTYRMVEHLGRWGMLDVLLVAVMIAFVKLGDLVHFSAGPGLATFTGFVLVSMSASLLFNPQALWQSSAEATDPGPSNEPVISIPGSSTIPMASPARPRFHWSWLLVPLAMAGAVWAWQLNTADRGRLIEISFQQGHGLRVGAELKHLGVTIGRVEDLRLTADASAIEVLVRMTPGGGQVARQGSRFWIVRPQLDLTGARGLETIVGDKLLAMHPGPSDAPEETRFVGLEEPPLPEEGLTGGLPITLQATNADGLAPGVPIFFRGLRVGSVQSASLAADGSAIEAQALIRPEYRWLVRSNARFWNASGVSLEAGFTSFRVQMGPVESWMRGRIEFVVPDPPQPLAVEGARFVLADKPDPDWLNWSPSLTDQGTPAGLVRPRLERLVRTDRVKSWFRTRTVTTEGWLLGVPGGYVTPASLVADAQPETTTLSIAGQTLSLDSLKPENSRQGLIWITAPERTGPPAHFRSPGVVEDGYVIVGSEEPVVIPAARLTPADGAWSFDSKLQIPRYWQGAAFVSTKDQAVIGVVEISGNRKRILPWPGPMESPPVPKSSP